MSLFRRIFLINNGVGSYNNLWQMPVCALQPSSSNIYISQRFITIKDKKILKKLGIPIPPKKPANSYLLFIQDHKDKYYKSSEGMKYTDFVKKVAQEWAQIDEAEKKNMQKEYEKRMNDYINELLEYDKSITEEQRNLVEKEKKKAEQRHNQIVLKKKLEELGRPKKPISAFGLYIMDHMKKENISGNLKKVMLEVGNKWKILSTDEKKMYTDKYKKLWNEYQHTLLEWEKQMIKLGYTDYIRNKTLEQLIDKSPPKNT
ncbi:transcription factor A, mitochondrial [Orussus abietinus]|uniref:transcription factor A, mitochondrial n=1 Tax=Orussus abietinus TaxID=222816 RepID=UPI00062694E8|nr:transcription factor A, mitochondrial [Orussus abietinus]